MQPWRPRPGVFTAYEEKWRAERNLLVEKSNAAKALKARRPPRALNRRQSNLFENLTESRQQVDTSDDSLLAMDDEALLQHARAALADRRLNIKSQKTLHERRLLESVAPPKPPPPKVVAGAEAAALQTGKADTKALPKGRLLLALSLSADARHSTVGSRSSSPLKKKMGTVKAALAASRALVEASSTSAARTGPSKDGDEAGGELPGTPGEASSSSSKYSRPPSSSSSSSKLPQLVKRMSLRPAQESTHLAASSVLATFTRQTNYLEANGNDAHNDNGGGGHGDNSIDEASRSSKGNCSTVNGSASFDRKSLSTPHSPASKTLSPDALRKSRRTPKSSSSSANANGGVEDPFADFYGEASVHGLGGPAYVMRSPMAKLRAAECFQEYEANEAQRKKEKAAAAAAARLKRKTSGKNLIKGALSTASSPPSSFVGKLRTDRAVSGSSAKSDDAPPVEASSSPKSITTEPGPAPAAPSPGPAAVEAPIITGGIGSKEADASSSNVNGDDNIKSNVSRDGLGDFIGNGGIGDNSLSLITSGGSVDSVTSSLSVGSLMKSIGRPPGDGEGDTTTDTSFASPNRKKGGLASAAGLFAAAAAAATSSPGAGGSNNSSSDERGRGSSPLTLQRAAMRVKNKSSSSPSSSVSPTNARGSSRNGYNSNNSSSHSLVKSPSSFAGRRQQRMPSRMTSAVLMAAAEAAQTAALLPPPPITPVRPVPPGYKRSRIHSSSSTSSSTSSAGKGAPLPGSVSTSSSSSSSSSSSTVPQRFDAPDAEILASNIALRAFKNKSKLVKKLRKVSVLLKSAAIGANHNPEPSAHVAEALKKWEEKGKNRVARLAKKLNNANGVKSGDNKASGSGKTGSDANVNSGGGNVSSPPKATTSSAVLGEGTMTTLVPPSKVEDKRIIAALVAHLNEIGRLDLRSHPRVRGASMEPLLWALYRTKGVTELDISHSKVMPSGAAALRLLGFSPSVTSLDLTSSSIRASGASVMAQNYLGRHDGCSLTYLNLSRNHISASGCIDVCNALLRSCPNLISLDLSENHIHGPEAWASIGHLIDASPKAPPPKSISHSSHNNHHNHSNHSNNSISGAAAAAAAIDDSDASTYKHVAKRALTAKVMQKWGGLMNSRENSREGEEGNSGARRSAAAKVGGLFSKISMLQLRRSKQEKEDEEQRAKDAARAARVAAAKAQSESEAEAASSVTNSLFGQPEFGKGVGDGPPSLTWVDLCGNEACDEGAAAMAFGLERNGTLTHLNLRSCSLGSNGCRSILIAARSARALTFINVAMNGIGYGLLPSANALPPSSSSSTTSPQAVMMGTESSSSSGKSYPSRSNAANMVALYNSDSGSSGNNLRWKDNDNGGGSRDHHGSNQNYFSQGEGGGGHMSEGSRFGVLKGGALSRNSGAPSLFGGAGGEGNKPLSPYTAAIGGYSNGDGDVSGGNSGSSSRNSFREASMTPPMYDLLPATPPTDSVTLASIHRERGTLGPMVGTSNSHNHSNSRKSPFKSPSRSGSRPTSRSGFHSAPRSTSRAGSRPGSSRPGSRGGSSRPNTRPPPATDVGYLRDQVPWGGLDDECASGGSKKHDEMRLTLDMRVPHGFADLNKENLTILKLERFGQAEQLGMAIGMQIVGIAGSKIKTKAEFEEIIQQLQEDDIEKVPLQYVDNRKVKKAALGIDDDDDGLDAPPPGTLLATATAAFLHRYFDLCPWLLRLNASNNAGVPGVLILKKPEYKTGDLVEVDWRGRGQYFKATILRVNEPSQSFDVKYKIDKVVDQLVPPYRIRGYVKERPDDPRPPAKY